MLKRENLWVLGLSSIGLLAACGESGVGSTGASVEEEIRACSDGYADCDDDDCMTGVLDCIDGVDGDDVYEDDIADECDELYEVCVTKDDDGCEDLKYACMECAARHDEDDYDEDGDRDDGTDDDYDEDEDRDDGKDDDYDEDEDRDNGQDDDYDEDEDRDDGKDDDFDEDEDRDDYDD